MSFSRGRISAAAMLQKQINRKGKQSCALIFRAIPCHQQKKQNNDQVASVKILWKQLPEKPSHAVLRGFVLLRPVRFLFRRRWHHRRRTFFLRRRWRTWILFRLWSSMRCRPDLIRHAVSAKAAVGLWNITVIHAYHLEKGRLMPCGPSTDAAIFAILAARIAFSSFLIRWRLK